MEQTDEYLVERSRQGDPQAFKELVNRHQGQVAGVVQSMLGVTPEAEDVGQEVFVRFYKALDQFKGESAVSTYLVRIAINLSLNEIKKRKKRNLLFTWEEEGRRVGVAADNQDLKEAVAYEVSKLSPEYQSVVILRMLEGYSTEETAKLLGIPLGTVLSRLARAQKKLKESLMKYKK